MQLNNNLNKHTRLLKAPVFIGAFFIFFSNTLNIYASHIFTHPLISSPFYRDGMEESSATIKLNTQTKFPNPIKKFLFKYQRKKKIAAALAFPFPFGCVGLHRVYLGTAAHVPIVYAATAGGIFGIIPLLDCIYLLTQKNISDYENNNNVIMWINHSSKQPPSVNVTTEQN